MSEDLDETFLDLTLGEEFAKAPTYIRALAIQQRKDRHHFSRELGKLSSSLGEEPDADGRGGKGLIGDVRKMSRDITGLMSLRDKGLGAIAAIGLFGALIILGVTHWVQSVVSSGAK